MNSVNIIGRLTRDPQVNRKGENVSARLSVAVNDGYGENERTSFINVVAFGKTAENCEKYLSKGRQVGVTGRIQTGSYEKDGRTIYTTDVIANRIEFLGGGDGAKNSGGSSSSKSEPAPAPAEAPANYVTDDDIPF